jgi:formylglycine-generating enzyme required for sulfatase activity
MSRLIFSRFVGLLVFILLLNGCASSPTVRNIQYYEGLGRTDGPPYSPRNKAASWVGSERSAHTYGAEEIGRLDIVGPKHGYGSILTVRPDCVRDIAPKAAAEAGADFYSLDYEAHTYSRNEVVEVKDYRWGSDQTGYLHSYEPVVERRSYPAWYCYLYRIEEGYIATTEADSRRDIDATAADVGTGKERAVQAEGLSIDLGGGTTMEFVLIPAGSFYMGSPPEEKDRSSGEGPVRRVQITKPLYIGKYEVTQAQYKAVVGSNPSHFSGADLPVESVSWQEAMLFCDKLTNSYGSHFRLPTEAEWEYACRAGSQSRFSYGDDPDYAQLAQYAWYDDNSDEKTHSVGQKKPNKFGLYDMYGNVWEWCSDWYTDSYRNMTTVDPTGPSSGEHRTLRGGSWYNNAGRCRSAARSLGTPGNRFTSSGFRVVLELE